MENECFQRFGAILEYLVDLISSYGVWSHFGAILGRFWGYLGLVLRGAGTSRRAKNLRKTRVFNVLEPSWNILSILYRLMAFRGHVEVILGLCWSHVGLFLEPCWGHLGALWARSGAFWGSPWCPGAFRAGFLHLATSLLSACFELALSLPSACFQLASSLLSACHHLRFSKLSSLH